MGGLAMRAPVLAAMFLIVTLATLAMPGSANFIGEFYILNGLFQEKIVYAFVARAGVALAAFYALRLYQRTMHNRLPPGSSRARSRCATGSCWRRWWRHRRPRALPGPDPRARRGVGGGVGALAAAEATADARRGGRGDGRRGGERVTFTAPDIDYAGISPIIALTAGVCVVLMAGVFARRHQRSCARRSASPPSPPPRACASGSGARTRTSSPARCGSTSSALAMALIAIGCAAFVIPLGLARRGVRPRRGARRPGRVPGPGALLGAGHGAARPGAEPGASSSSRSSCSRCRSTCSAAPRRRRSSRSSRASST